MADTKTSDEADGAPALLTDQVRIARSGANNRLTLGDVVGLGVSGLTTGVIPVMGATTLGDSPFQITGSLISTTDVTSGFGFASGLPQMVDGPDGLKATFASVADVYSGNPGLQITGTGSPSPWMGLAIQPEVGASGPTYLSLNGFGGSSAFWNLTTAQGPVGSPTASQSGDSIFVMSGFGYGTSGYQQAIGIESDILENFSTGHSGANWYIQTVPIGSSALATRFMIDGLGNTNILNGGLVVGAPTGGSQGAGTAIATSLFTSEAAAILHTKTTITDGAGVAAGTLLNAPAAGNPTKWLPYDDNGTARYIPAW